MGRDDQVVSPGDILAQLPAQGEVKIGAGIRTNGPQLQTLRAGILRHTKSGKLWVEGRQKRYFPAVGDNVVGVVIERLSENFNVDIGGPFPAVLNVLAFEGATRRNRPKLAEGDLLYARVVHARCDIETELSCMDASGKAAGYGPLKGGYVIRCSTALARSLLAQPTCPILTALGAALQYEIAVGQNGRVWVNAAKPATVIVIANAIERSEYLSAAQSKMLAEKLVARTNA